MSSADRLQASPGIPVLIERTGVVFLETSPSWVQDLEQINWKPEQVVIADPLSYCAGVVRANIAADEMLEEYKDWKDAEGVSVYFYHAPIHNDTKLQEWEAKGAKVVETLDEVPDGSPVLFSAHGVSPLVWIEAKRRHFRGRDATCPLVDKTHREAIDLAKKDYKILLVGHEKHDEITGTVGEAPDNIVVINPKIDFHDLVGIINGMKDVPIALRTQTTLAVEDTLDLIEFVKSLRADLNLPSHSDICFATQNRQEAIIKAISLTGVDNIVIFGSHEGKRKPSSNSIRLREVAIEHGVGAVLVEDIGEIEASNLRQCRRLGISAGASADPKRVAEMLAALRELGLTNDRIKRLTVAEEPQVFASAKSFDFSKAA